VRDANPLERRWEACLVCPDSSSSQPQYLTEQELSEGVALYLNANPREGLTEKRARKAKPPPNTPHNPSPKKGGGA
jgi:hypothetical protein